MKAMILAAGKGERMRPLTDNTPKPLLKVGGKPLIYWHIGKLVKCGFKEIVINNAYLGEQIIDNLGDGSQFGIKIYHSSENNGALETAGGIRNALDYLGDNPFLLINGDVWTDWDFSNAYDHKVVKGCHLIFVNNPSHNSKGDFELNGNIVKLSKGEENTLIYSGLGVYSTEMFKGIAKGEYAKLKPLLDEYIIKGLVTGQKHVGKWVDVGTPNRLKELDDILNSHNY